MHTRNNLETIILMWTTIEVSDNNITIIIFDIILERIFILISLLIFWIINYIYSPSWDKDLKAILKINNEKFYFDLIKVLTSLLVPEFFVLDNYLFLFIFY